jgi:hypothetical protein
MWILFTLVMGIKQHCTILCNVYTHLRGNLFFSSHISGRKIYKPDASILESAKHPSISDPGITSEPCTPRKI